MRKRFIRAALFFSLIAGTLIASGCHSALESAPGALSGYWKADNAYGDGFEISGTSFKQYDDGTKSLSFGGTIVNSSGLNAESGFLTVQIDDSGTWGKTVGSFLVIRWKNLSDRGVSESTPYKTGADSSGLASQALAEGEYTEANGYFAMYADYLKQ